MTVLYYIVDYEDNEVVIQINAAEAVENIVPRNTLTEQIDFKPHHASDYNIFKGYDRADFSSHLIPSKYFQPKEKTKLYSKLQTFNVDYSRKCD